MGLQENYPTKVGIEPHTSAKEKMDVDDCKYLGNLPRFLWGNLSQLLTGLGPHDCLEPRNRKLRSHVLYDPT